MATYYDKGTGKEYEAIQWTGKNIDQIIAFVRKGTVKHNAVNRELTITNPLWDHLKYGQSVGLGDWLVRSGDRIDVCTNFLFTQSFIRLEGDADPVQISRSKQWPLYKYRLSGISVEAVQWNGKDLAEIKAFAGEDKIRWDRISLQYYIYSMDTDNDIFWSALKPGEYIYRLHQDNPQNIAPLSIMSEWLFTSIFTPITNKEETVPAQPQTQDPFEPMRQVIDLDSYEYLNEAYPFYIQAIEHALTAGKAPAEIGRFVVENTSSRRDIGLLCEQAARHIQRMRQAA